MRAWMRRRLGWTRALRMRLASMRGVRMRLRSTPAHAAASTASVALAQRHALAFSFARQAYAERAVAPASRVARVMAATRASHARVACAQVAARVASLAAREPCRARPAVDAFRVHAAHVNARPVSIATRLASDAECAPKHAFQAARGARSALAPGWASALPVRSKRVLASSAGRALERARRHVAGAL